MAEDNKVEGTGGGKISGTAPAKSDPKRFLLRIDPNLYEALEKWAADELRSVNGQIEYLLTAAVKKAARARKKG